MKKSRIYWCIFDLPKKEAHLDELQRESESPDLWNDRDHAQKLMKQLSDLRDEINSWHSLQKHVADTLELAEMEDDSLQAELDQELAAIEKEVDQRELTTLLSGQYDQGNALLAIHSGAGGTDSQDWAGMLERMYLRWIEKRGFEADVIDLAEGEEAGIKNVTIAVTGPYAFGYMRSEKGVHRLVRLSPFDSAHRRHTSFAMVEVLPEVDDDQTIVINPEDIRIDIFKSSGAGGQNVQKNATAIRLTHIPTGLVVTCQNERSQIQNRENAMRVLKARLLEIKQANQDKALSELKGDYVKVEWGSQIRSYVLHPYQMVKDHRTDFEVGNAQGVLEGDLDSLIEAYLRSDENN
jgi:peptide chain release factor 2